MVIVIDLGEWNDLYFFNKKDVGERFVLFVWKIVYGEKDIVVLGLFYKFMKIEGNKVIIEFLEVGSGFVVKGGGEFKYFVIVGSDKKFVWVKVIIEGDKVVVWNDSILNLVYVWYVWVDNLEGVNFYNKEGLFVFLFIIEEEV